MAYQLKTFADLQAAIREELGIASTDTVSINRIKRDINIVYGEVKSENRWWWLQGTTSLSLPAYTNTGTASVAANSATVTMSTAPGAKAGWYFAADGYAEVYRIESISGTTVKLSAPYNGTTNTTAAYRIWTDCVALPTDCKETVEVWHDHFSQPLEHAGWQEFRRIRSASPRAEGFPRTHHTADFNDPLSTSSITSLPALTSRASSGVVKTLIFASGVPATVVAGLKIKVSAAGASGYNGEWVVASVSTTTATNDTIKFVGTLDETESATADTTLTVQAVAEEADLQRYRKLYYYPAQYSSRITLHVDYVKEASDLSNDTDEPAMPMEDRVVLLYGALHRAWSRERNPEEAARNLSLYTNRVAKMASKMQDNFDKPKFSVSNRYMAAKRSSSRRKSGEFASPGVWGGGGSATTVTGTPSTVAVFDGDGELEGSSSITTTELGYLDGASANIQGQLDALSTLADGKIYVGNSSNVATEVTPSGDVTITSAGVTAIGSGVIVNADVSASAALALSKLAATTASRAIVSDGSGVITPATTTSTEIGYVNGVTSAIQTQLNAKLTSTLADGSVFIGNGSNVATANAVTGDVTISNTGVTAIAGGAIVNADVNASAAIVHTKMAALTASRAMVTDGSGFASAATTTAAEIGYVNGVTSAIQTQIDGKATRAISVSTKTGDYTVLTTDDFLIFDANAASRTATLYAASGNTGRVIRIKRVDSTAFAPGNIVTIDANGSETIDGALTRKLATNYEEMTLVCDGSNWHILDHDYPQGWTAFTPTGAFDNTTYTGLYRRVADSIEVQVKMAFTGTPSNIAIQTVNIPNSASWTIDTAKLAGGTTADILVEGSAYIIDTGTSAFSGSPRYNSTTSINITSHNAAGTSTAHGVFDEATPFGIVNGDAAYVYFTVPITNFEG